MVEHSPHVINVIWDVVPRNPVREIQTNEYHTRSKGLVNSRSASEISSSNPKASIISKTPTPFASKTSAPAACNSSLASATLTSSVDYSIVEDLKKTRANISLFELLKLQEQKISCPQPVNV